MVKSKKIAIESAQGENDPKVSSWKYKHVLTNNIFNFLLFLYFYYIFGILWVITCFFYVNKK